MVQRWNVCTIVFWRVVWYRAGMFLLCDRGRGVAVVVTSWLWLCRVRRGRGCRVLGVTPAVPCPGRRGRRGCGARRLCVAVVWLRHADEC